MIRAAGHRSQRRTQCELFVPFCLSDLGNRIPKHGRRFKEQYVLSDTSRNTFRGRDPGTWGLWMPHAMKKGLLPVSLGIQPSSFRSAFLPVAMLLVTQSGRAIAFGLTASLLCDGRSRTRAQTFSATCPPQSIHAPLRISHESESPSATHRFRTQHFIPSHVAWVVFIVKNLPRQHRSSRQIP